MGLFNDAIHLQLVKRQQWVTSLPIWMQNQSLWHWQRRLRHLLPLTLSLSSLLGSGLCFRQHRFIDSLFARNQSGETIATRHANEHDGRRQRGEERERWEGRGWRRRSGFPHSDRPRMGLDGGCRYVWCEGRVGGWWGGGFLQLVRYLVRKATDLSQASAEAQRSHFRSM